MNVGSSIVRGLLGAVPIVGGFAAYTATRERGWGTWGSAFAAAGAAIAGAVGGGLAQGLLEESGAISGIQVTRRRVAGWETPRDLRRSGNLYGLRGWETPGDLRRSGNLYGLRGQGVPANVSQNWRSKGALGLTEVRRYA